MTEVWKVIPYAKTHEVSNMGRIRNIKSYKRWNIRIRTGWVTKKGYMRINLINKHYQVHRLVADTFIKNDNPNKTEVNHKNFDRTDNRVENLEWVTHAENVRYSHKAGKFKNRATIATKQVRNKTTGEIFDSISIAAKAYNSTYAAIMHAVLGHNKSQNCEWEYTGFKIYGKTTAR